MTVQTAVRTLREEGFVRSRAGSGVYVRDQANLPAPSEQDQVLSGVAALLFALGHLKHVTRAVGWPRDPRPPRLVKVGLAFARFRRCQCAPG